MTMDKLIVLAACIAAASALGSWKSGLSVRFGVGLFGWGSSYFIHVPQTVADAKNSRWLETPRPDGPLSSLIMMCPSQNDVVLCALYDDNGDVAGLQIALPTDSYTGAVLDWATQGYTYWTAPANSNGQVRNYWTLQQYFVSEATLKKSKEERRASRVAGRVLQENAVWVTGFNGDLMRISGNANEVTDTATTHFTKQACIILMGRHYYYNMTTATQCRSDTLLPWFPLLDVGTDQLIGMGFTSFGQLPANALVKDYFERPNVSNVKLIVPDGPECLFELADSPGLTTMHIYYVDSPWLINCINN
ncbi:uncharacterized protein LOC114364502 [Ostrinia furnacalis]|uniref:uncharacterized protein LOC114364502 n=1 Tax=Ostrinia furnacalis TaxID=93504 RepID=UPI00103E3C86|nr:uncharacterized protein LOC114364502 [Ostrinia furnacalis]